MGFFSWELSDKPGQAVRNRYTEDGPTPCKMIAPDGREWIERNYQGYGVFGGKPFYELLAELNSPDPKEIEEWGLHDLGIELDYSGEDVIRPKLVSMDCYTRWEDLPDSPNARCQGYF